MDLKTVFEEVSKEMQSDFARAQASLSHSGLKGQANEETVRRFLRKYLPNTLDVAGGTLVDSNGEQSRQLDVVISDAAKTPIFFESGDSRVIPVECAYAVLEVKAYLSAAELENAFRNMKSVKGLSKAALFKLGGPIHHTQTLYGREWEHWPIHYFVFAYDSPSLESVRANLIQLQGGEEVHKRIDSICVLSKGVILNRGKDGRFSALPSPDSIIAASDTTQPLLLFYALISVFLNQANMDYVTFNLMPYLKDIQF